MAEKESNLVRIGGLWAHKDRNGNTYLSGKLGAAQLLIFFNQNKEESKQPDYSMFVATPRDRQVRGEHKAGPLDEGPPPPTDDIPFG